MEMRQVAFAVFNDRTTEAARDKALQWFIDRGHWDASVHLILPAVFAELRKPIYEGVSFDDTAWTAAAEVLDMTIQHAIDAKAV